MAAVCDSLEFLGSSGFSFESYSETHKYAIHRASDHRQAREKLIQKIPFKLDGQQIQAISGDPEFGTGDLKLEYPDSYVSSISIAGAGGGAQRKGEFVGEVAYQGCNPRYRANFGTGGGTVHIDQAIATTIFGNGCNIKNLIGLNPDGSVDGTDIVAPAPRFSLTVCYPPGFMNCTRFRELGEIVGSTNQFAWDPDVGQTGTPCFGPEELLFIGAEGSIPVLGPQEITFNFEFQPTVTLNAELRTGTVLISKPGHQIVTYEYRHEIDAACNFKIMMAEAAYLQRVYRRRDWADFADYHLPYTP